MGKKWVLCVGLVLVVAIAFVAMPAVADMGASDPGVGRDPYAVAVEGLDPVSAAVGGGVGRLVGGVLGGGLWVPTVVMTAGNVDAATRTTLDVYHYLGAYTAWWVTTPARIGGFVWWAVGVMADGKGDPGGPLSAPEHQRL